MEWAQSVGVRVERVDLICSTKIVELVKLIVRKRYADTLVSIELVSSRRKDSEHILTSCDDRRHVARLESVQGDKRVNATSGDDGVVSVTQCSMSVEDTVCYTVLEQRCDVA